MHTLNDAKYLQVPPIPKKNQTDSWVKNRLETHNLVLDHGESLEPYPLFAAHVKGILDAKRTSGVPAEQFQDFLVDLTTYEGHNEETMLVNLLPHLIKSKRKVAVPGGVLPEGEKLQVQSYRRDGLITIVNKEFNLELLNFGDDGAALHEGLVASDITIPKPNRVYGIDPKKNKDKFPPYFKIFPELDRYLQVVEGIHHPFFIIEVKSASGSMMDAETSASRGGGGLTVASRLLRRILGMNTTGLGPDQETFVFSATLDPKAIFIWVNWAEVKGEDEGETIYHMTKVKQYFLDDKLQFRGIRRTLHNILDWGCGKRLEGMKPLYEAIVKFEAGQTEGLNPLWEAILKSLQDGQTEGNPTKKRKTTG